MRDYYPCALRAPPVERREEALVVLESLPRFRERFGQLLDVVRLQARDDAKVIRDDPTHFAVAFFAGRFRFDGSRRPVRASIVRSTSTA